MKSRKYWLMKTEPEVFSIDDLAARPGKKEHWDGVRNYQARNFMRDEMRKGDRVLFYHSRNEPIGVAGVAEISREASPDPSALDSGSKYYDPKASPDRNPWVMVEVRLVERFPAVVTRQVLAEAPGLESMLVMKRGMRLSIQPVKPEEYEIVIALAQGSKNSRKPKASSRT